MCINMLLLEHDVAFSYATVKVEHIRFVLLLLNCLITFRLAYHNPSSLLSHLIG